MRGHQSFFFFFFNFGIHYSLSLDFTAYQMLIDGIIGFLRRDTGTENKGMLSSRTLSIWRSNTSIEVERFEDFFPQVNYTERRFYNNNTGWNSILLHHKHNQVSFADQRKDVFVSARVKQMY